MPGRIVRKWRPPLWLVLLATVGAVLGLPLAGIVAVRYLWPVMGYREAVWAVGGAVLVVSLLIAFALWRILLRPIEALADRAAQITGGTPGALDPLPHYGTAEMQQLGQSILDMGRTLQGREAALRSYADHATHELRSPLTVMRGAAEMLAGDDLGPADRERLLARIAQAADRMTALLEVQRDFARAQEPVAQGTCRVSALLPDLRQAFPKLDFQIVQDAEVALPTTVLQVVLQQLASNASAHGAKAVTLSATRDSLRFEDDGPGVSSGNRDRIFDPFFTTRRDAGGTGMGLAIVRRMLQAHDAAIELSGDGPGAAFVVTLD